MSRPLVFAARTAGLANRLRALVGWEALAHFRNMPFALYWKPTHECDAGFADLFEAGDYRLIGRAAFELHKRTGAEIREDLFWFTAIWDRFGKDICDWEPFRDFALDQLANLRPVPAVREKLDAFTAAHDFSRVEGLHIRMTDNLQAYANWAKTTPGFEMAYVSKLEGFMGYIERTLAVSPQTRFFIATDNADVEKKLHERYGNTVFTYPKTYTGGTERVVSLRQRKVFNLEKRTSSIQDALIELLLLARCQKIIGTYYSSYSKLAGAIGRVKESYELRGDDPHLASIAKHV